MNLIEKTCIAIRHNPRVAGAGWLWDMVRPIYHSVVNTVARRGLERVMNGADRILIDPKYRMLGEVYEQVWTHLMSNVKSGDVIADVSAHIGVYALPFAKRGVYEVVLSPLSRMGTIFAA